MPVFDLAPGPILKAVEHPSSVTAVTCCENERVIIWHSLRLFSLNN
jgi:hypothetical protein